MIPIRSPTTERNFRPITTIIINNKRGKFIMNEIIKIANEIQPVVTSFNAVTIDDKKRFYNALNNPTGDVKDLINQQIEITDFHMKWEQRNDEEGFVYDRIKTTIITADGKSYSTTFKSFAKSLVQLMEVFGLPETWENHKITIIVRNVAYQGGLHDGMAIDVV